MSLYVLKLKLGTLKKEKEKNEMYFVTVEWKGKFGKQSSFLSVDPPIHGYSLEHH